jgi:hypothetical protein
LEAEGETDVPQRAEYFVIITTATKLLRKLLRLSRTPGFCSMMPINLTTSSIGAPLSVPQVSSVEGPEIGTHSLQLEDRTYFKQRSERTRLSGKCKNRKANFENQERG